MKNFKATTDTLAIFEDGGSYTSAVICIHTVPKMAKTDNPFFGRVTKRSEMTIGLNGIYQNQINNRRDKEGKKTDFEAKSNWFEKMNDTINGAIVRNKNRGIVMEDGVYQEWKDTVSDLAYLLCCVTNTKTTWYLDGREANEGEIVAIKCFTTETDYAKYQGLEKENELPVITVGLGNITEIRYGGKVVKFMDVSDAEKIEDYEAIEKVKKHRKKVTARVRKAKRIEEKMKEAKESKGLVWVG